MIDIDWASFFLGVLSTYVLSIAIVLFLYLILSDTPNKP